MKIFIGALALAVAIPVTAQTAPAGAPDAHAQHQGMDHSMHQQGKHDCTDCCVKMKQSGGKMECMDKRGEGKPAAPASGGHQGLAGHAH